MQKITIPDSCPTPRAFVPHACSPECAHVYNELEFRKVSPLAIPFYLGWARLDNILYPNLNDFFLNFV